MRKLIGVTLLLVVGISLQAGVAGYGWENQRYGFRLTLPGSWRGYRVVQKETSWPPAGKAYTYYFALPTSSREWNESDAPVGYASLFALTVFTGTQWEILKKAPEAEMLFSGEAVLGQNSSVVIAWSQGQDCPADLRGRFGEVGDIIKTFSFTAR